jgi:hypothetical protein
MAMKQTWRIINPHSSACVCFQSFCVMVANLFEAINLLPYELQREH